MNLLDQVKSWPGGIESISEWIGAGGVVVDISEAQSRADVCKGCQKNESAVVSETVALAVKRHLEIKNKLNLRVQGERQLKTCSVCGCANRLQIWMPMPLVQSQLTEEEKQQLAIPCWKRINQP